MVDAIYIQCRGCGKTYPLAMLTRRCSERCDRAIHWLEGPNAASRWIMVDGVKPDFVIEKVSNRRKGVMP